MECGVYRPSIGQAVAVRLRKAWQLASCTLYQNRRCAALLSAIGAR